MVSVQASIQWWHAKPHLSRAASDGRRTRMALSCMVRHLAFADIAAGRMDDALERLEQSVHLRHQLGFQTGEAAGVVALAELSIDTGAIERV